MKTEKIETGAIKFNALKNKFIQPLMNFLFNNHSNMNVY